MRRLLAVLIGLIVFLQSYATHLVGGEITYVRLSGNTIRVTLIVYRDNINGSPGALLDDPAVISFYNDNGTFLQAIEVPLDGFTTVPPILNPCQDIMPNIETQRGVYTFDVDLNTINNYNPALGVTMVYGRCCRNSIINNLFDPGTQGFSATVRVPPANIINNSPTFNEFKQYLCAGRFNLLNFAATDTDGDSLAYHLCDALLGLGDDNCTTLNPACPIADANWLNSGNIYNNYGPPYNTVNWGSGYSADAPFGAGTTTLNQNTGIMHVINPMTGVYVMRVCVSEYRNGQYLCTVSRDFQYLVTPCDFPEIEVTTDANIPQDPFTGLYTIDAKCNGGTITFDLANDVGVSSYRWDFGDPNTTSDVSTLQNPSYFYSDTGTYIVTVIGYAPDGCADTSRGLVTFYPIFTPDFTYVDSCLNMAVQFSDISTSTIGNVNSWQWSFGDPFTVVDTSRSQFPAYTYTQSGTYNVEVVVTTSKGCIDTVYHPVTIHPLPDLGFTLPSPVCQYDTLNFSNVSTIANGSIVGYEWQVGSTLFSTNNVSYSFNTIGNVPVRLVGVSNLGCRDTLYRTINVLPLPVVTLTNDTAICPNTSLQLQAGGGVTYSWTPATYLNNPNIANPVATPTTAVQYAVLVTAASGCQAGDSVQISLNPLPVIDAGTDTSVCLGALSFRDSVQLQASGGISYVWSPGGSLSNANIVNPIARPVQNTTYVVTGYDAIGCFSTDTITIFVLNPALNLVVENSKDICIYDTTTLTVIQQGNSAYSWFPATGISDAISGNPLFFPLDTTVYVFTVQNYCYQKQDTATIIVHPLPVIATGRLDSICIGDSVQLNATGASVYQWQASPTLSNLTIANPIAFPVTTTSYYVHGTDVFGCSSNDSVTILVYPFPVTGVLPDVPYICLGTSIQLTASGGVQYQWTENNETLSNPNIANPVATPQDTTTYYVTITNQHNCSSDDSVTINVQHPITASAQSPFDVCIGNTIQLSASGGLYYRWNPPIYLTDANIANPQAAPGESIIYTVIVSNDCFSDSVPVTVTIRPLPLVDAGTDTTIFRNTYAQLNGETNGISFYWTPTNDLSDSLSLRPTASPLYTAQYYLYAETEYGCINYDSVHIFIDAKTLLLIPTAFSPNGDGTNDIFRIVSPTLNIRNLEEFAVFSRWGEKLFSTNDLNQGWNGKYKGTDQPIGVYMWYVKAITYDDEKIFRTGNVTLVW